MRSRTWSAWSCAVEVTTLRERDLDAATRIVERVMAEVDAAASRFRNDSDLARINAGAGRFVLVSPLALELVDLSLAVAERTAGAVTPTIGAALLALGYDDDIDVVRRRPGALDVPPMPAPDAATSVRLDPRLRRVGVTSGSRLDLGAIAKAYAVDEAVARCASAGVAGVLVSIGGDLAVHGTATEGWTIAVSETADAPAELVTIESGALATSSTTGRRWAAGRHHLVDPRTGRCASGPWRTATVWAPSAIEANLLSTWALVDACAAAEALAADERPARLVDVSGAVERRHGWPVEAMEAAS
jgi:thiamine biosynthesis lipoprotein